MAQVLFCKVFYQYELVILTTYPSLIFFCKALYPPIKIPINPIAAAICPSVMFSMIVTYFLTL